MCTAISFVNGRHYFGRNLDLNYDLPVSFLIVPRNYPLVFKKEEAILSHYALYGIGRIREDYPFYFDLANESGLTFAGLNFPGFAYFGRPKESRINLAPYELPLYLLGKCKSVQEAKEELGKIYLADLPFAKDRPVATLHFYLSDKKECIVIEQTKDGRKVYDNPYRVLTNNPPFDYHRYNICNYRNVTNREPVNRFSEKLPLEAYGKAMGAIGLPGDSSPASRFVKAAFLLQNTVKYGKGTDRSPSEEKRNVSTEFHILNSVSTLIGESLRDNGSYEYTIYSSVYSLDEKELFVKTYPYSQLQRLSLRKEDLDGKELISYPALLQETYKDING